MRHQALTMNADCKDPMLCDVFTPCMGYIKNALDNCDDVSPVTCMLCLASTFEAQVHWMNRDAIEHLDEPELLEYMIDRDAMAPGYEFDA